MPRKRRKKRFVAEAVHLPPTVCDCGNTTTGGGACSVCVRKIQAEAEETANPRPPEPPPPEPEPPPVQRTVFLGAHPGCVRCGRTDIRDLLCDSCNAALHHSPFDHRGDPKIVYPRPCNREAGW